MKQNKYKAKKGAPFTNKQAQEFGERIEEISNGLKRGVQPIDLIEDGSDVESPFHTYFEWDNEKAGHKHRLHQARHVLNSIVETVLIEGVEHERNSFFNVVDVKTQENIYVTLKQAIENTDYRKELLKKLIKQLENVTLTMKMFKQYED